MKILITGAMGVKAYQLKSKLNGHDVLLGDFADIPSPMLASGGFIQLPAPADPAYMHLMLALCLDAGISEIYALSLAEFDALQEAKLLFEEYGIIILSADNEV